MQANKKTSHPATSRLFAALYNGAELTAKQIAARFKVASPRDLVYNLRQEGYAIDLVTQENSKGIQRRRYVLRG